MQCAIGIPLNPPKLIARNESLELKGLHIFRDVLVLFIYCKILYVIGKPQIYLNAESDSTVYSYCQQTIDEESIKNATNYYSLDALSASANDAVYQLLKQTVSCTVNLGSRRWYINKF